MTQIKITSKKFKHSPWMTSGLLISHKQKEKLFAKRKKCPSALNISTFKTYNNLYNKIRRAAKKFYYEKQFSKFAHNIKDTWTVIKEILGMKKCKDQIPDFLRKMKILSQIIWKFPMASITFSLMLAKTWLIKFLQLM